MTTITIHLGNELDAAAGPNGAVSGGNGATPTARLILIPNDYKEEIKQNIPCIYLSNEKESIALADKISEKTGAKVEYKAKSLNKWKLGELDNASDKTLKERLPPYIEMDPEWKSYDGESFNEYKQRAIKEFERLLKEAEKGSAIVLSGMTLCLFKAFAEEKTERAERGSEDKFYSIDSDVFLKTGFTDLPIHEVEQEEDELEVEPIEEEEEE